MKKDSKLIHAGRKKSITQGLVNPPLRRASTILFDSMAHLAEAYKNRNKGAEVYGRRGTTTHFALCEAMAELDNAAGCYAYPCGSAAISASLLAFLQQGDHLLMVDSVYEPTRDFCVQTLAQLGIQTEFYDPLSGAAIADLIRDNTRVIFIESPGSLSMEVQDIPALIEVAKRHNITTLMDNTYCTSWHFKPLELGVDVSIQSATKYIMGHSDAMLGIACANAAHWDTLREASYRLGYCVSADDAYTALRGSRTLSLRLAKHEQNALEIARWLQTRPEVDHVRHPLLGDCPGHSHYLRDVGAGNGLFSFVLKSDDRIALAEMLDNMRHFKMGFSWGGYESLILAATHMQSRRSATEWKAPGALIRLHIGLEDPQDLIDDLADGLDRFIKCIAR